MSPDVKVSCIRRGTGKVKCSDRQRGCEIQEIFIRYKIVQYEERKRDLANLIAVSLWGWVLCPLHAPRL